MNFVPVLQQYPGQHAEHTGTFIREVVRRLGGAAAANLVTQGGCGTEDVKMVLQVCAGLL